MSVQELNLSLKGESGRAWINTLDTDWTYLEMAIDMTMHQPPARIIGSEPGYQIACSGYHKRVFPWRVLQVALNFSC